MLVGKTQGIELGARHADVVDQLAAAQRIEIDAGRRGAGKFRNGVDIDVERIDEDAAVRRIRARLLRAIGE